MAGSWHTDTSPPLDRLGLGQNGSDPGWQDKHMSPSKCNASRLGKQQKRVNSEKMRVGYEALARVGG